MDLAQKYRPSAAGDMIGGYGPALAAALKSGGHSFLFVGPSGCGKTTLARILAKDLGCREPIEIDAATSGKVDDARGLKQLADGCEVDGSARVLILDECHAATPQAWQALLKMVEEPAEGVYWCLCTTEESKVPKTIRTRCHRIPVREASEDELVDLIAYVCEQEKLELGEDIMGIAARQSFGSPRMALQNLALVADCADRSEAAQRLLAPAEGREIIHLCRLLINGTDFAGAHKIISTMQPMEAESLRLGVVNYMNAVLMKSGGKPGTARKALAVLEAFESPCNQGERMAPIWLAVGRLTMEG